jgi:perosamine synthetase
VPVIEDAACALGATLNQKQAGAWGDLGCFSFHPRKAITTGEGGIITTDDDGLARRLRALRNHGQDPEAAGPDFVMPGFNYRLTDIQAALGLTQLRKLDRIVMARRELAARYDGLLAGGSMEVPFVAPGSLPVYQSYVALLPDADAERRTEIMSQLKSQGIETAIGTWHMPLTTYFRSRYGFRPGDFPASEQVFRRALTLPLHEGIHADEQAFVVQRLLACLGEASTEMQAWPTVGRPSGDS